MIKLKSELEAHVFKGFQTVCYLYLFKYKRYQLSFLKEYPMPNNIPACPQCGLENTYPDGDNYVCPDCAYEWPQSGPVASDEDASAATVVRDANGSVLQDGDAVILVKDLKVKGSSSVLKKGSKIKSIRLVDGADGHNVDCKTDLGSMLLKSEFLKKA